MGHPHIIWATRADLLVAGRCVDGWRDGQTHTACACANLLHETYGQLVALGFDVTAFTPAPYQRHRL